VSAAEELIDVLSFEVPTFACAKELLARLRPTWLGQIDDLGDAWSVVVEFRPEGRDLAVLLRVARSWLDGSGLGAVRMRLDGRDYLLEAADPVAVRVAT
jgi:hypothetical protein